MTTPQPRECEDFDFVSAVPHCTCHTVGTVLRHFGHGHLGNGPYGLDISATENAEGGHFRAAITINLGLGCVHA